MAQVGLENFREYLPRVLRAIENSTFISFDLEFFGCPYARHHDAANLMDTSEERFEVETFNFSIFKRGLYSMCLSSQGAEFLEEHQFQFNNLIKDGIHFLNENEFKTFQQEFKAANFFKEFMKSGLSKKIDQLKHVVLMALQADDTYPDSPQDQPQSKPLDEIELGLCFPSWRMNNYEEMIVAKELERTFKSYSFKLSIVKQVLQIKPKVDDVAEDFSYFYGFSTVVRAISRLQKIIVGYNCFMDLLHLYQSFIDDLPETYAQFKLNFNSFFPYVYDTKLLGLEFTKSHEIPVFLNSLSDFVHFAKERYATRWNSFPPYKRRTLMELPQDVHYHEAASDAYATGRLFVIFIKAFNRRISDRSFSNLLKDVKLKTLNRIPLALSNSEHCFLEGEDVIGLRPKLIRVRCRRHNLCFLSPWLSRAAVSFSHVVLGPPKINASRLNALIYLLIEVFGWYRVTFKVDENGTTLIIASATLFIHDRIVCYVMDHPEYEFVEEKTLLSRMW